MKSAVFWIVHNTTNLSYLSPLSVTLILGISAMHMITTLVLRCADVFECCGYFIWSTVYDYYDRGGGLALTKFASNENINQDIIPKKYQIIFKYVEISRNIRNTHLGCSTALWSSIVHFDSDPRRHVASPKCATKLPCNCLAQCWILKWDMFTYSFRQDEFPKHSRRSHGVIWIPDKEFIATTTEYLYKITDIES